MKERYQAAFVIPIGANKVLGEDGWEFKSSERLSKKLGQYLVEVLNLEFVETYSGIRRYAGDHIKMSIVFDGDNEIESIVTRNSKTGEITNSFVTMPPRTN